MESAISVTGIFSCCSSPGGQPGALQQRPCFIGEDLKSRAAAVRFVHERQGGSIAAGGEVPGVAVRQHTIARVNQRRAVPAHGQAHRGIFGVNRPGLNQHARRNLGCGLE